MGKRFLLSIVGVLIIGGLKGQHWTQYNIDQFGPNKIYSYHLDTISNKILMNSENGFCIFDLNTNNYDTCFVGINQRFLNNNKQLAYANSKYWIVTSSGLSSFDGTSFIHYSSSNGLINDTINDLTKDKNDNLWIASPNGVSQFNGQQFIHDSGMHGSQIFIDDSNRVYVLKRNSIQIGGLSSNDSLYIKSANGWTSGAFSGNIGSKFNRSNSILPVKDIIVKDGEIYIEALFSNVIHKMSLSARIDTVPIKIENLEENLFAYDDLEVDHLGRQWITTCSSFMPMYSSKDSIFFPHNLKLNGKSCINNLTNQINVFGTNILAYVNGNFYLNKITNQAMNGSHIKEISINSIKTSVSASGILFRDENKGLSDFEVSKGTNRHAINGANLLMSSKKVGDNVFQMNQLKPHVGSFNIGPQSNTFGLEGKWITKINLQDIQHHRSNYNQPNYVAKSEILSWPGNGDSTLGVAYQLAPFEDLNQNGVYEPMQGDYPKIKGDEAIFWINHLDDFEYHGMLYGFNTPTDSALNQTLFLSYKIYNRSINVYDSINAAMIVDFDLGNSADDYVGCDSLSNSFFVYNGDAFDESVQGQNGFAAEIPFVGVKFLTDSMMGFTPIGPANANQLEWNNILKGYNTFGQPYQFPGTSVKTKYFYTNTGGFWSEDDTDPSSTVLPNIAGDRRPLGLLPYFSLQPGESKTIEMVIGYALEPNGGRIGSKDKLLNYLDSAKRFWESNVLIGIDEKTAQQKPETFQLYPNPAEDQLVIQSERKGEMVQFFSMTGHLVRTERITQNRQVFDISDLTSGLYFIRIGNAVQKLVVN